MGRIGSKRNMALFRDEHSMFTYGCVDILIEFLFGPICNPQNRENVLRFGEAGFKTEITEYPCLTIIFGTMR